MTTFRLQRGWLVALAVAAMTVATGYANSLSVTYFNVSTSDPSYGNMCCGTASNEVLNTLGPDGLPLFNPAYSGGPFPNSADLHSTLSGNELTWWSPALNSHVTQTGTGTVTLPFSVPFNFYPPNGTGPNDSSGGMAAIFSGTLNAPTTETVSFSIGADDSAFAYLDGQNVCDLGGVHGYSAGTCVAPFQITAGSHNLEVFFIDLNQVQSGFSFDVETQGVTTSAVPEPTSLLMLGTGLLGLGGSLKRKFFS